MLDVTTVLGDAAEVVDPKGENEDLSVVCGFVAWALEHFDSTAAGTPRPYPPLSAARSTVDAEVADEVAQRLTGE